MAKERRDCLTCKWEPVWRKMERFFYQENSVELVLRSVERGQCRSPSGARSVKAARFPQGTSISTPYIDRKYVKRNCPAWAAKDGETE